MDGSDRLNCPRCNTPYRTGMKFCKTCGDTLGQAQADTMPIAPAVGPPQGPGGAYATPVPVEAAGEEAGAKRRGGRAWMVAVIVIILVAVAGGIILALVLLKSSKLAVPDLEGSNISEARAQLENDGFAVEEVYEESGKYDKYTVIAQDPKPGSEVEKGSTVILTVSLGASAEEETAEDKEEEAAPKPPDVMQTEAGKNAPFYTVIVTCLDPRSGHTQQEAEAFAGQVRQGGLHAGILDSTQFRSLRQPYWVVYSGIFKDPGGQSAAEAHLATVLAKGYGNAYVRFVDFSGAGETGPVLP